MAIQVNSSKEILPGITVPSYYMRLDITLLASGSKTSVIKKYYADRDSYVSGKPCLKQLRHREISYDRNEDGNDILVFLHNEIKSDIIQEEAVAESAIIIRDI